MNDLTAPVEDLPARAAIADKRLARSRNQIIIVGFVLLIVAFATAGLSVQALNRAQSNSDAQQRVNGAKIDALNQQLVDARSALVKQQADVLAKLQEQAERDACSLKYVRATTTTFETETSIFFELVVIGFQTAPVGTPGSDRTDKINAVLTRLDTARIAHDKAVTDAAAYIAAESPLPCPIGEPK